MLKPLTLILALCGLAVSASSAHAVCTATGCEGKIERLYVNAAAGSFVLVDMGGDSTTSNKPGNCVLHSNVYIKLDVSNEQGRAIYNMLLAAYLGGKSVGIRTSDTENNTGACLVRYATNPPN